MSESTKPAGWDLVDRVAQHMVKSIDYIEHVYEGAPALDRGPIMRNMKRWRDRLQEAIASKPAPLDAPLHAAVVLLRRYNEWRRGADIPQPHPTEIGLAIDAVIAAVDTRPPAEAQAVASDEDRFEQFVQAAIANSPEPLRELGEYLTSVLDDDQWPAADRLLLQLATTPPSAPVGVEDIPVLGDLLYSVRHVLSASDEGVDYGLNRATLDAMTALGLLDKTGRGKWAPTEAAAQFAAALAQQPAAVDARILALADRLVAPGPKAAHVSASECHELRDFIHALAGQQPAADRAALRSIYDLLKVETEADAGAEIARLHLIEAKAEVPAAVDEAGKMLAEQVSSVAALLVGYGETAEFAAAKLRDALREYDAAQQEGES